MKHWLEKEETNNKSHVYNREVSVQLTEPTPPTFNNRIEYVCVCVCVCVQALAEVDKKAKSMTQIAMEYGVLRSTLSLWSKNKEALRQAQGNLVPARKRTRTAKNSDAEAVLLMCFEDVTVQKFKFLFQVINKKEREMPKGREWMIDTFSWVTSWL